MHINRSHSPVTSIAQILSHVAKSNTEMHSRPIPRTHRSTHNDDVDFDRDTGVTTQNLHTKLL